MDPLTDIEKLRRLIPHWIEHNRSHASEFVRWAELARAAGAEQTAALIENAAAQLQKAEADLSAALEKAGGTAGAHEHEGHHHHHHHGA
jgi:hypothetical protein